jgi:hypothetical protein
MAVFIETMIIAALVALGIIVGGAAIIRGLLVSRRPSHHMVCLYPVWYNFARMHKSLRCSPAMTAGLSPTLWSVDDIVDLIDARAEAPQKRGPYKPRQPKISN